MPALEIKSKFIDGTPVPAEYMQRLSGFVSDCCAYEEEFGSEEERILRDEDFFNRPVVVRPAAVRDGSS